MPSERLPADELPRAQMRCPGSEAARRTCTGFFGKVLSCTSVYVCLVLPCCLQLICYYSPFELAESIDEILTLKETENRQGKHGVVAAVLVVEVTSDRQLRCQHTRWQERHAAGFRASHEREKKLRSPAVCAYAVQPHLQPAHERYGNQAFCRPSLP